MIRPTHALVAVAAVALASAALASSAPSAPEDPLYVEHCAACHGRNGHATFPGRMMGAGSFATARFWEGRPADRLPETLARGGAAMGLSKAMPAFGDELDEAERARVLAVALAFRP